MKAHNTIYEIKKKMENINSTNLWIVYNLVVGRYRR